MSDTPITDAVYPPDVIDKHYKEFGEAWGWGTLKKMRDTSRRLERDRAELVEALELAIGHWKGWVDQSTGLTPADILGFEADDYAKCRALLARIKGES